MALDATQFTIVLLGTWFSSKSFLCECRSLEGYEYPVYITKACPKNLTEWKERSNALSCNASNAYMCMPNENITNLLEFCYSIGQILVEKGLCLFLYKRHSTVDDYSCHNFTYGCPTSNYRSQEVEKYPGCVSIGNGCFLAEPSCVKKNVDTTDNEDTKNNHLNPIGIVAGVLVFLIVAIIIIIIIIYRKIKKKKQNQQIKAFKCFEICKRQNKKDQEHNYDNIGETTAQLQEDQEHNYDNIGETGQMLKDGPTEQQQEDQEHNYDNIGETDQMLKDGPTEQQQEGDERMVTEHLPFIDRGEDKKVVAAIDFGTTYSGIAYARGRSSETKLKQWYSETGDKFSKTPTTLLLDNQNEFVAFGFDAEEKFKNYIKDDTYKNYRYFKYFKMKLLDKESFGSSVEVEDHLGESLDALEVFSKSLNYMREVVMDMLEKDDDTHVANNKNNIEWIITVPAIWEEVAKQFVRNAAKKANIPDNKLNLAFEPECAAIHVLMNNIEMNSSNDVSNTAFSPGEIFLVADLGGGTADFAVVEVTEKQTLKNRRCPSGGNWGGENINNAIFKKIEETISPGKLEEFRKSKADVLDVKNEIERQKTTLTEGDKLTLTELPAFLSQKADRNVKKKSKENDFIYWKGDKLVFEPPILDDIFKSLLGKITNHIQTIIEDTNLKGLNTILLVGGFANSDIVQNTVKNTFSNLDVIIPDESGLAVLKGAVIYGKFKRIVEMRVCKYTYGVATNRFARDDDPDANVKHMKGKHYICTNVFEKLISTGDQVSVNETVEREFHPSDLTRKKIDLYIYRSITPNPKFVTNCELTAIIKVDMPEIVKGVEQAVTILMHFGKTEISFSAEDKTTGVKGAKIQLQQSFY